MNSSFSYIGERAVIQFPVNFPIKCTACASGIRESSFKRDILRHQKFCKSLPPKCSSIKSVVFQCHVCGEESPDRRKATTHQATHFGDPKLKIPEYPCTNCNRKFGTQKALSSHVRCCKPPENTQTISILRAIENIRHEVEIATVVPEPEELPAIMPEAPMLAAMQEVPVPAAMPEVQVPASGAASPAAMPEVHQPAPVAAMPEVQVPASGAASPAAMPEVHLPAPVAAMPEVQVPAAVSAPLAATNEHTRQ